MDLNRQIRVIPFATPFSRGLSRGRGCGGYGLIIVNCGAKKGEERQRDIDRDRERGRDTGKEKKKGDVEIYLINCLGCLKA